MALIELTVPDIGDVSDAAVIELLVQPGDPIKLEQSLITIESDKASMEVPSTHAGVLKELRVRLGDKVSQGSLVAVLEVAEATQGAAPAAAPAPVAAAVVTPASSPAPVAAEPVERTHPTAALAALPAEPSASVPHASPSVRRFARELGVPLAQVPGSGPKGRITHVDVQNFVKGALTGATTPAAPVASGGASTGVADLGGMTLLPWPKVDFSKFGPIERQPLSRIKKISGANLHRNWVRIPHVTNHDEADITELEAFRLKLNDEHAKAGLKFTLLAFLLKACAVALRKFPQFNASLDGDDLVLKQYVHIGFAADTPNGLVVPVIRDVDSKSLSQLATETAALAAKAREGKLTPAEMQGGNFSISSLGGFGGTTFTPIINAPEVAILGVCRSAMKPVWNGSAFEPRLMLPLSLSYDHRVIDGASAARFNTYLASLLADFRRALV
ncbi:MAG TPA: dihydrolipoyllysine-residue acetyltransferase [Aquabacterium sp.]|uniref:dihydrolipoyllysine-residue acetyltransferase n=1 Tax=Aquabacterium sp. TaxID=1872578 RepID=UPI002D85480A|nr:dihydrolipoyllysine-residue acetyltransferase [Aquabacterium sp.]HET6788542.1 dihydrolipoyllysine-residue acetyltransferase [Aquabacterium sp.]HEX5373560.1 dihydrolipoyllysine-residue acetyltransferase [Aquabacterium sp.]